MGFHLGDENENTDTWAPFIQSLTSFVLGKGFVTCAFDKYKDYFEKYYALKLLIWDITYKHELSKIYVCELFNHIYMIILAYWC